MHVGKDYLASKNSLKNSRGRCYVLTFEELLKTMNRIGKSF